MIYIPWWHNTTYLGHPLLRTRKVIHYPVTTDILQRTPESELYKNERELTARENCNSLAQDVKLVWPAGTPHAQPKKPWSVWWPLALQWHSLCQCSWVIIIHTLTTWMHTGIFVWEGRLQSMLLSDTLFQASLQNFLRAPPHASVYMILAGYFSLSEG